jgi:hypothetical protein
MRGNLMVTFLGQTSIFWLDLFTLPFTLFFAFWSLFTLVKMTKKTWPTHPDGKKFLQSTFEVILGSTLETNFKRSLKFFK